MASKGYCAYGNVCKFLHPATVTTETEDAILIIDFENQLCNDKNYFNLRIRKTLQELWPVVEIARSHDDIYEQLIINKPRAIIVKDRFSKALLETLRRFIQYISKTNAILILCGEFSKLSQEDEVNLLFMQLGVEWKVASIRHQDEKEYSKSKQKINLILTEKFAQVHNTLPCLPQTLLSYCIESYEDIKMLKNVPKSESVYKKVSGIHEVDCFTSLAFKRLGNGGVAFLGDSSEFSDSIIPEIASNKLGLLYDYNIANQIGPRYNEGFENIMYNYINSNYDKTEDPVINVSCINDEIAKLLSCGAEEVLY